MPLSYDRQGSKGLMVNTAFAFLIFGQWQSISPCARRQMLLPIYTFDCSALVLTSFASARNTVISARCLLADALLSVDRQANACRKIINWRRYLQFPVHCQSSSGLLKRLPAFISVQTS